MQFDMNRTWSQAVAMVRGNFQLLALIAGIFMLLPSLIMVIAMPQVFELALPGADPQAAEQRLAALMPSFIGVITVIMLVSLVGYAAMVALIGPARPTVGGAIGRAITALPTLVGAFLVFLVGYVVAVLVAGLVVGLLAAALGMAAGNGLAAFLLVVGLLAVIGYLLSRFALLLPVVVLDGVRNPLRAYTRSWRQTRPARWRIFGFFVLLTVAYFVIALVLVMVMGLLGAAAGGTGSLFAFGIVSGVLGMLVAMLVSGILVSLHQQLAGGDSPALA